MEMLATEDLTKVFAGRAAVDGVNLTVRRGEVLGFLGPNGAGKSTTMKMVSGFLTPTRGTARICGHDVQEAPLAAKRRLGYLPEGAPLYPDMTPRAFLKFIGQTRGLSGKKLRGRISAVMEETNLRSVMEQPIETLSKGYKRRVGLAQALIHDPEVLLLDEPTDGLDPNQKFEVRRLIHDMASQKAIVISTHILEEVDAVCTRAVILAEGRIVADGKPAELMGRSHLYNAVSVDVPENMAGEVEAALARLPDAAAVERHLGPAGTARLVVVPRDRRPIFAEVSGVVTANGWPVTGLRAESGSLDDVFRQMTGRADRTPAREVA